MNVERVNGAPIAKVCSGEFEPLLEAPLYAFAVGAGTPVLFIQGVGVHGLGWTPQIEVLRRSHRCIAFDHRGVGRTPRGGEPITVERMAADALAVLDAARVDAAHVVGHSLGGAIALELALLHRERVKSLSLVCTFGAGRQIPLSPRLVRLALRSRFGNRAMRRRAFLEIVLSRAALRRRDPAELASELEPLFGRDLADSPRIVGEQLAALRNYDVRARLGELALLPTLVISASEDPISPPAIGRELARSIHGAAFELLDASHGAPIECAARTNELLLAHFARADSFASPTRRAAARSEP